MLVVSVRNLHSFALLSFRCNSNNNSYYYNNKSRTISFCFCRHFTYFSLSPFLSFFCCSCDRDCGVAVNFVFFFSRGLFCLPLFHFVAVCDVLNEHLQILKFISYVCVCKQLNTHTHMYTYTYICIYSHTHSG